MTQQWRIRIQGKPRKEPDKALVIRAVLALGEQMQREAQEREQAQVDKPQEDAEDDG
jgi:hypothetical protein